MFLMSWLWLGFCPNLVFFISGSTVSYMIFMYLSLILNAYLSLNILLKYFWNMFNINSVSVIKLLSSTVMAQISTFYPSITYFICLQIEVWNWFYVLTYFSQLIFFCHLIVLFGVSWFCKYFYSLLCGIM